MKNFEMRYPLDGTSALQPEFGHVPAAGAIIEFPGTFPKALARRLRTRRDHRLQRIVRTPTTALRKRCGPFTAAA